MIVDLCSSSDDDEAADAENSHVAAIDLCSDSEEEPFFKANDAAMFAPGGPTGPTRDDRNPKRQRRGESSDGPNPRAAASRAAGDLQEPAPTDHGDVRLLSDILSGAPPGDSIIRSSVPAEGVSAFKIPFRDALLALLPIFISALAPLRAAIMGEEDLASRSFGGLPKPCPEKNFGVMAVAMAALARKMGWTSMKFHVTSAAAHLARASVLDFTRATR
ncbi:hypothetical protein JL720_13790 [Aureococcus anophagefferens]|nr:hypothetical protein JL720_13790 [Aureococcus anophagefferens]